jgi:hypothetical protein
VNFYFMSKVKHRYSVDASCKGDLLLCKFKYSRQLKQGPIFVFDSFIQEPILRLLNLKLQRRRCGMLERLRNAISCVVNFYNAGGVVTHGRRIGSRYSNVRQHSITTLYNMEHG